MDVQTIKTQTLDTNYDLKVWFNWHDHLSALYIVKKNCILAYCTKLPKINITILFSTKIKCGTSLLTSIKSFKIRQKADHFSFCQSMIYIQFLPRIYWIFSPPQHAKHTKRSYNHWTQVWSKVYKLFLYA